MNWRKLSTKDLLQSWSVPRTISLAAHAIKASVKLLILAYKASGFLAKGSCRYYPTCSDYALECFNQFGTRKAMRLTLCRICSCRPFSKKSLYDPVPGGK